MSEITAFEQFKDELIAKMDANTLKTETCWLWLGGSSEGYGRISFKRDGRAFNFLTHRVAWALIHGRMPDQYIDHLCRNPSCVNPAHLENVSNKENVLRGIGKTAVNSRKTHCRNGHEFTPENTYLVPKRNTRHCKQCRNELKLRPDIIEKQNAYYAQKKGYS